MAPSGNGYLWELTSGVDVNRVYWGVNKYAGGSGAGNPAGASFYEHGMDAYGRVVVGGNSAVGTHYFYDDTTGYLDGIQSTKSGTTYQSLAYQWSAIGNLISRHSSKRGSGLDLIH